MFLAPDQLAALTGRVRAAARALGRDYAQALAGHASGDQTETYIRARDTVPVRPLR